MIVFELAVLLAVSSVAAFPCWPYSADWGYLPSAAAGSLLLVVMLVAVGDKSPNQLSRRAVAAPVVKVAAAPTTDADRRRSVEIVKVTPPITQ
jgi:uncharacterized protein DUF3309